MKKIIENSLNNTIKDLDLPEVEFSLQIPKNKEHGDLATNIAFLLAKEIGENPFNIDVSQFWVMTPESEGDFSQSTGQTEAITIDVWVSSFDMSYVAILEVQRLAKNTHIYLYLLDLLYMDSIFS